MKGATGTAFVAIDGAGATTIVSARGANAHLDDEHVHRNGVTIGGAAVVLTQLGVPVAAVRAALEIARSVGTTTVLDPCPPDDITDDLLRLVDVCTPNETEIERLTGVSVADLDGVRRAAHALLARGCAAVVVTLGARGAYLASEHGVDLHVPAIPVEVVDPTGAGDACCGALAAALRAGFRSPMRCAKRSSPARWPPRASARCRHSRRGRRSTRDSRGDRRTAPPGRARSARSGWNAVGAPSNGSGGPLLGDNPPSPGEHHAATGGAGARLHGNTPGRLGGCGFAGPMCSRGLTGRFEDRRPGFDCLLPSQPAGLGMVSRIGRFLVSRARVSWPSLHRRSTASPTNPVITAATAPMASP